MDLLSSGSSSESEEGNTADETTLGTDTAEDGGPPKKRIRNVPHEPGDWHAHVYIPVKETKAFRAVRKSALKRGRIPDILQLKSFHWDMHEDFHISLSREFVLKKHQIQPFVEGLKHEIEHMAPFSVAVMDDVAVHVNDFHTRSFLALKASGGSENVTRLIEHVNLVAQTFSVPSYYDDPSIHVSIASAVGNVHAAKDDVSFSKKRKHDDVVAVAEDDDVLEFGFRVSEVHVVAGKRVHTIAFSSNKKVGVDDT